MGSQRVRHGLVTKQQQQNSCVTRILEWACWGCCVTRAHRVVSMGWERGAAQDEPDTRQVERWQSWEVREGWLREQRPRGLMRSYREGFWTSHSLCPTRLEVFLFKYWRERWPNKRVPRWQTPCNLKIYRQILKITTLIGFAPFLSQISSI